MIRQVDLEKECYIKVYKHMNEIVVALCDAELLGKEFREGKVILKVSKKFYGGNKMKLKDVINILEQATIINAIGKNVIGLLIYLFGNINDAILWVGNVPHVQIVK